MSEKYKENEVIIRPAKREDMADIAEMIQVRTSSLLFMCLRNFIT